MFLVANFRERAETFFFLSLVRAMGMFWVPCPGSLPRNDLQATSSERPLKGPLPWMTMLSRILCGGQGEGESQPDDGVENGTLEKTTKEDSKVSFSPFHLKPRELVHVTAREISVRLKEDPLNPKDNSTQMEDSVLGLGGWDWAEGYWARTLPEAPL